VIFVRDPLHDPEPLVRRVYAYVARRIGDGPDADDVTGDVFERAVRYRASYDTSQGKPIVWLIGIARHRIDDFRRTRTDGWSDPPDLAEADLGENAGDRFEEESLRRIELASAIATLDEGDQDLIALRYGADLTARQIATLLEMRVNTVEVALHRAVGRLRTRVEREEESPARAGVMIGR
jgi:RNA polymerase sigma-70 factor (ECF subfamily)